MGYHVLLCSANVVDSCDHLLGWMEVHVGVRQVMKVLRSISWVLVFLVLIAWCPSHCLHRLLSVRMTYLVAVGDDLEHGVG